MSKNNEAAEITVTRGRAEIIRQADFTKQEAAVILRVSIGTIENLIRAGTLTTYKVGRVRRIRCESLQALRGGQAA